MSSEPYPLPQIPYLRLRARLRADGGARLPRYLGSTLRGAFGHALRSLVCTMGPEQPCATCSLRGPCVNTRLFETFIEGEPPPFLQGLKTSPRPYVLEPQGPLADDARTFAPGEHLVFDVLLFGQAVELQGYVVLALERMSERGLGTRQHRFVLEEVRYPDNQGNWVTGYARSSPKWAGPAPAASLLPAAPAAQNVERLTLHFATPTRIRRQGELRRKVAFRPLAFVMLRRLLEMAHFHVPGADVSWDFNGYLRQADAVEVTRSDLHWHHWERRSNRQQRTHEMGGFVGRLHLRGDLAPFLPLLSAAEILHLGKGTTFGLGKLEVES